jgi:hypothetical protein
MAYTSFSVLVRTEDVYDGKPPFHVVVKGGKKLKVLREVYTQVYRKAKEYGKSYGYEDKERTDKLLADFKEKLTENMTVVSKQKKIVFEELTFGWENLMEETKVLLDGFTAKAIELSTCKVIEV